MLRVDGTLIEALGMTASPSPPEIDDVDNAFGDVME